MISITGIHKKFGSVTALDNFSFHAPGQSITILAGADGAGKSTLLKILVGLESPDSGKIKLNGREVAAGQGKISAVTGYMPEKFSLYLDLTVAENLNFFADIHEVPVQRKEKLKNRLLDKTGLSAFTKRRAGALSGGMKQKLALSCILLSSPEIILLDEPTTGVDPLSRIEFFSIIQELKNEGKTVILSTPYLDEAEKGDRVVFVKAGRNLLEGSIAEIKKEFPAEIVRFTPDSDVFRSFQALRAEPGLKNRVYLKGNQIRILRTPELKLPDRLADEKLIFEPPALEDIYIYYERMGEK